MMKENAGGVQSQKYVDCAAGWIGSPKEEELPPFNFSIEDKSERIIKVIGGVRRSLVCVGFV